MGSADGVMNWDALQGRSHVSRKFPASYEGDCADCMGIIDPGDLIGYVEDEICCEECYDKAMRDM